MIAPWNSKNDQPASELPVSQRRLTLTVIEAAAAVKAVDVVVSDAYKGIKHAAKASIEKIRGSGPGPSSSEDSAK